MYNIYFFLNIWHWFIYFQEFVIMFSFLNWCKISCFIALHNSSDLFKASKPSYLKCYFLLKLINCFDDHKYAILLNTYIYYCISQICRCQSISHQPFSQALQRNPVGCLWNAIKQVRKPYFYLSLIAVSRFAIWWNQQLFTVNRAYNSSSERWGLRIPPTLTVSLSLTYMVLM